MEPSSHQVTELLHAWSEGEPQALDRLTPLVYDELHRLARRHMAHERSGHTLQTTALVNEAYLELVDSVHADWHDRTHYAVCSRLMQAGDVARYRNGQLPQFPVLVARREGDLSHSRVGESRGDAHCAGRPLRAGGGFAGCAPGRLFQLLVIVDAGG